ncbi:hypothetical protein [Candidatus Poriferisodalis sp.]|uniref:hypothetical protein n=1 Tax=Candidatus Poriferisodalis sp. TaxID=3101277 RepID=UPI003B527255
MGHGERQESAFFDLSGELSLTYALLDNTRTWRERAVHEILLRDSDHVDASISYQIRLPLELVRRYEPAAQVGDRARLLLPLTLRPKRLLLNVGLVGPEGNPASLILRRDAAYIQAGYMSFVDERPLDEQPLRGALWAGVSDYTAWAWREKYLGVAKRPRGYRRTESDHAWRARTLATYLNADLDFDISAQEVARWLRRMDDARNDLIDALSEGEDPESSSECILLAIPFMPVSPGDITDIDALVEEFCAAVDDMSDRAKRTLAELGRRWHLIIDTIVPIGRPCIIKLTEQRPWPNSPSPDLEQEIAIGDAATTHIEIRAADPGVVLDRLRVVNLEGKRVDVTVGHDARTTADAVALYADTSIPPRVVRVGLRARPRRGYRRPIAWLQLLIALAGVTMLCLPGTLKPMVESLALLTFPLTLAGAVVLTRDATSLAERLLRRSRTRLMVSIAALWTVAMCRLLLHADVEWAVSAWSRTRCIFGLIC